MVKTGEDMKKLKKVKEEKTVTTQQKWKCEMFWTTFTVTAKYITNYCA